MMPLPNGVTLYFAAKWLVTAINIVINKYTPTEPKKNLRALVRARKTLEKAYLEK